MNQAITEYAARNGHDPIAVEMLANMVCSRLRDWDVEPDLDVILAAVHDSRRAVKTMAIKTRTRHEDFVSLMAGVVA